MKSWLEDKVYKYIQHVRRGNLLLLKDSLESYAFDICY